MSQLMNKFDPNYAVHPGEILEEYLEAREMRKNDFAIRTGLTEKTINQIIKGKAPVTAKTALKFERVLGVSAELWVNLESNYQLFKEKQESLKRLKRYTEWSKRFPIAQLKKRGFLPKINNPDEITEGLFRFFRVDSPEIWEDKYHTIPIALRHSKAFESNRESLITWMRIGEIQAENTECPPFNSIAFEDALKGIRNLTVMDPEIFEPAMKSLCEGAGVVLAFVEEFPKTHLFGMARWVTPTKALIILSLRRKSDDYFWFSFFHEAAHILKHNKRFKSKYFIDEKDMTESFLEVEADQFAAEFLIPGEDYIRFLKYHDPISKSDIISFANLLGIAPGIVVGRLQHDSIIQYNQFNELKSRFEFNHS